MGDTPELEIFSSPAETVELGQIDTWKIPVPEKPNSANRTSIKTDGFVVDMAPLCYVTNGEITANSKPTRFFSRKWSQQRGSEKKSNPTDDGNEGEGNLVASASLKAKPAGASMLERPNVGPEDRAVSPAQAHHQITIRTSSGGGAESRSPAKRSSCRRSQIDPRKIFFFLATLSSIGTLVLIFFTLSMGKLSGDDDITAQNW